VYGPRRGQATHYLFDSKRAPLKRIELKKKRKRNKR
jgi:hypothetical protein